MRFLIVLVAVAAFICHFGLTIAKTAGDKVQTVNCSDPAVNCTGDGAWWNTALSVGGAVLSAIGK